jgi:NADPH-dependent 2,4-dienoyl-CoA reductase/sulfur reductase-like enzyme
MAQERLLIIGGVAAGMSAASRARKIDPRLEIVVLEKTHHVSYGICGLPFYLSGQIANADGLVVYTPEYFREKRAIDVRLEHEAMEIEPGRKIVRAMHKRSQPVEIHYDQLVIAAGGGTAMDIPGAQLQNVFTCNDLDTAIRFRAFLDEERPRKAAIVGSGYIGLEVADALVQRGIAVTVLERGDTVLEALEPEISKRVEAVLAAHGVQLVKNANVTSIAGGGERATTVQFGVGGSAAADIVVLATGIVPRVEMARAAGVEIGATGAIAVDERMRTNVNGIHAAGDCTEVRHLVSGRAARIPLGTTANKQGRVAGENAAGGRANFEGVVGTLATKIFELEVARTGLSTEQARESGFQPGSLTITSISHAKYLGGKPLDVTLIWDRASARLLGCQMCGEAGVAKRIDVAAMALHARMRVPDLLHLDLSYAPPFAPVWDPLLIATHEANKKITGG